MTKQDKDAREQFEIEGEEDPELEEVLRDYDFSKPPLTPEDFAHAAAFADKAVDWISSRAAMQNCSMAAGATRGKHLRVSGRAQRRPPRPIRMYIRRK